MIRLFRVFIPTSVVALILSEFFLVLACYVVAIYIILDFQFTNEFVMFLLYEGGLLKTGVVVATVMGGLYAIDLYSQIKVKSRARLLQDLCQVFGIALLAQGLISYALPAARMGRGGMLYGSLAAGTALFAWRVFYSAVILDVVGGQKILFIGANEVVRDIAAHIVANPELGLQVAGYLLASEPADTPLPGGRALGVVSDVRKVAEQVHPGRIVVGMSERRDRMPVQELLELRFSGYLIEEAGATYEAVCGRICTKELRPSQLIFSGALGPRRGSLLIQTALNYAASLFGAIVSLPVMALVALLVKATSPGPVLYRQTRVGKDGRLFTVYKFRSMRADAEKNTGAVWAVKDDPRVTPVGKWLRLLRLDELPQFFNVLRGEMSLVGPRPERPEFVQTLSEQIPYYRQRHCVKPGVTGWAQINHKYGDTMEDVITKLEYDLYYIKHISPSLDAYIIFHTLKTMLQSRGAQ